MPPPARRTVEDLKAYLPLDLGLTQAVKRSRLTLTVPPSGHERRWFRVVSASLFSLLSAGVWVGYQTRLIAPQRLPDGPQGFLAMAVVTAFLVYLDLWRGFNSVTVTLGPAGLRRRLRPFPLGLDLSAPLADVDGFSVFDATDRADSGPSTPDWQVQMLRPGGGLRRLGLRLREPDHAQYVADVLNAHLATLREAPRG